MKEFLKNPFTPTFGSIPLQLAGRDRIISEILDGLGNGPVNICTTTEKRMNTGFSANNKI